MTANFSVGIPTELHLSRSDIIDENLIGRRRTLQSIATPLLKRFLLPQGTDSLHPKGVPHQMCSSGLAPEAVESALEKIKDTMALYIKCADPSESAARMERLRQAEALGVLEKNAANMVRKANCRAHTSERPPEMDIGMPSSQERTPISARLGPLNAESPPSDRVPVSARLGPLPGEPPAPDGLNPSPGNTGSRIPISARLRPMTEEEVLGGTSNYEVPLTKKRKPGRPPGIRKNIPPEGSEPNGISRKRKSIAEKPPTGSKKTGTEAVRPRKVTKNLRNKRATIDKSKLSKNPIWKVLFWVSSKIHNLFIRADAYKWAEKE
ncbi:hypothetical protein Bca52824_020712 [Brassica carinata]|uniref:Uncharacterized protein n=1 Tax=Brassica carinata TaxID=52824 RepID=A0A8X8AZU3_BRACI|nr:hypothetical protein Bca52824_020712 [Brassica carinata]